MPKIDDFMIRRLREEFSSCREKFLEFSGKLSNSPQFGETWARDKISRRFFECFSDWAYRVVLAFGLDRFPTGFNDPDRLIELRFDSNEPYRISSSKASLEDETSVLPSAPGLVRALTGVDDSAYAGLEIIYWAAAKRNPLILEPQYDGKTRALTGFVNIDEINLRSRVELWAEGCLAYRCCSRWMAHEQFIDWMTLAFEKLSSIKSPTPQIDKWYHEDPPPSDSPFKHLLRGSTSDGEEQTKFSKKDVADWWGIDVKTLEYEARRRHVYAQRMPGGDFMWFFRDPKELAKVNKARLAGVPTKKSKGKGENKGVKGQ